MDLIVGAGVLLAAGRGALVSAGALLGTAVGTGVGGGNGTSVGAGAHAASEPSKTVVMRRRDLSSMIPFSFFIQRQFEFAPIRSAEWMRDSRFAQSGNRRVACRFRHIGLMNWAMAYDLSFDIQLSGVVEGGAMEGVFESGAILHWIL